MRYDIRSKKTHQGECTFPTQLCQHPIQGKWDFCLTGKHPKEIKKQYKACHACAYEICLASLLEDRIINVSVGDVSKIR